MASPPRTPLDQKIHYATTDGKPMAETDLHRDILVYSIYALDDFYAADPLVYVSGDLLMFFERGNKRKHVAPDVFVVKGVPKRRRPNYLLWEEGKAPNVIFEITSSSTRKKDTHTKFELYRDTLKVQEYFLFDPLLDYLRPALQGYRLVSGEYVRIEPVDGRLPSEVLGLHLEQVGSELRLYNPRTQSYLPTMKEQIAARQRAEAEVVRLRQELEALRRQSGPKRG
jgi:Uma2 family endonuclease